MDVSHDNFDRNTMINPLLNEQMILGNLEQHRHVKYLAACILFINFLKIPGMVSVDYNPLLGRLR